MSRKAEKKNRNLYLCEWISRLLDDEGERYDGPGVVAAAAIYHFTLQSDNRKMRILETYRKEEIGRAYEQTGASAAAFEDEAAAARIAATQRRSRTRHPKEVG